MDEVIIKAEKRHERYVKQRNKWNTQSKAYYNTHKEEILAKMKTPEGREKQREYNRSYYYSNRDEILRKTREKYHKNKHKNGF